MDWQVVAAFVSALGLGSVLTRAVDAFVKWRAGKYQESHLNWKTIDRVHRDRQAVTEVLYQTRNQWHLEAGKEFSDMPQLPGHLKKSEDL